MAIQRCRRFAERVVGIDVEGEEHAAKTSRRKVIIEAWGVPGPVVVVVDVVDVVVVASVAVVVVDVVRNSVVVTGAVVVTSELSDAHKFKKAWRPVFGIRVRRARASQLGPLGLDTDGLCDLANWS